MGKYSGPGRNCLNKQLEEEEGEEAEECLYRKKKKTAVSTGHRFQMIDGLFALVQRRSLQVVLVVEDVTYSSSSNSSCHRRHSTTTGGRYLI